MPSSGERTGATDSQPVTTSDESGPRYVADDYRKPSLSEGFRALEGFRDRLRDHPGDDEGLGDLVELDAEPERLVGLSLDLAGCGPQLRGEVWNAGEPSRQIVRLGFDLLGSEFSQVCLRSRDVRAQFLDARRDGVGVDSGLERLR